MHQFKFCGVEAIDLTKIGGAVVKDLTKWIGMVDGDEDLTTYTETDPSSRATVTSSKVTISGLVLSEDLHVSKDFGANNINGFTVLFETNTTTGATGAVCAAAFSGNLVNRTEAATTDCFVQLNPELIILARGNAVVYVQYSCSVDTIYYLKLYRADGSDTIYLYIYSDSARTTLLDTLSVSGFGTATRYRYFQPVVSLAEEGSTIYNGYVQNFNLDI